jgi:hypothetical protein
LGRKTHRVIFRTHVNQQPIFQGHCDRCLWEKNLALGNDHIENCGGL